MMAKDLTARLFSTLDSSKYFLRNKIRRSTARQSMEDEAEWSQATPFTQSVPSKPQAPAMDDIVESLFKDIESAGNRA